MKRLVTPLALAIVSLGLATAALGGATTYAGPKQWSANESAGSSFSSYWLANSFSKYGSGYDTTVTFIDNKQYRWHNTVRNSSQVTEAYAPYPLTTKGHCKAHVGYFWGSCWLR